MYQNKVDKVNQADKNRPNPDDRSDNAERIQDAIDRTQYNMELAGEMIDRTSDDKTKRALTDKNARREQALDGLQKELIDESTK